MLRSLNLHTQGIRDTNQNPALWYPNIPNTKIAKNLQCLQIRTSFEDKPTNKIIDTLTEAQIHGQHLGICFIEREDGFEALPRDVPAGMNVKVLELAAGVGHQCLKAGGTETDTIGVFARVGGVDVPALVEVDGGEGWVGPVCEEGGEAGVGQDFVVRYPQFEELGAIVVDGGEDGVINVVDRVEGEFT